MTNEQQDSYVAALEYELAGYEAKGREDRAADVRAEIARVTGSDAPKQQERPSQKQATRRPRGAGKTTRGS